MVFVRRKCDKGGTRMQFSAMATGARWILCVLLQRDVLRQ
jgi:hypothetical protein